MISSYPNNHQEKKFLGNENANGDDDMLVENEGIVCKLPELVAFIIEQLRLWKLFSSRIDDYKIKKIAIIFM